MSEIMQIQSPIKIKPNLNIQLQPIRAYTLIGYKEI